MKPLTSLRAHAGSTRSSCIPGLATAAKAASYRCDLTSFPALELSRQRPLSNKIG